MVERRSVRFTPDGRFEEYDKTGVLLIRDGRPPEKMLFDNLTEEFAVAQIQTDSSDTLVDQRALSVPIQARSAEVVQSLEQNQIKIQTQSQMEWSSFLIIFFVLIVALYSVGVLIKRIKQLRSEYRKNEGFGSTNKSSLLADMDDEWRMQKIDHQTPQLRASGQFQEGLNKQFEQRWPAYSNGQIKTNTRQNRIRAQSQTLRYEDDEFKRS